MSGSTQEALKAEQIAFKIKREADEQNFRARAENINELLKKAEDNNIFLNKAIEEAKARAQHEEHSKLDDSYDNTNASLDAMLKAANTRLETLLIATLSEIDYIPDVQINPTPIGAKNFIPPVSGNQITNDCGTADCFQIDAPENTHTHWKGHHSSDLYHHDYMQ